MNLKMPKLVIGDLVAKVPIIQGGMGIGISLSSLASAVANAGGIGVISVAGMGFTRANFRNNPEKAIMEEFKEEVQKARAASNGIIGVNIMVVLTNFVDMVKASLAEGIDIIFSGSGLPLDLPAYKTADMKTKLVPIVSSARAAALITKKWLTKYNYLPDAFVVEGPMAGGHLGFKAEQIHDPNYALEKIIPEVVNEVKKYEEKYNKKIPIIAAGGVYSGEDIHKFLTLGAAGVQMGTRFVATHECDASMEFKQTLIDCKEEDIAIIKSPVGLPGRVIKNEFTEGVEAGLKHPISCPFDCIRTCDYEVTPYCISMALINAKKGNLKHGYAFAGQNASRVTGLLSVQELIDSLKNEYLQAVCPSKKSDLNVPTR